MHMAHHDNPAHYGIRTKNMKLIFFYGLPCDAPGAKKEPTEPFWEMYDLGKDPHEMNNVIDDPSYAALRKSMVTLLEATKAELGDTDEKFPELVAAKKKSLARLKSK